MKKFIITIIIAILIGIGLGIYSFNKFYEEEALPTISNKESVYAFQVGVFESFENANNLAQKYGGIVILEDNKYKVYIAIVKNSINTIKKYFDEKNIAYYLKEIEVSNDFLENLKLYEELIQNNNENYDTIIKSILKEYEKYENEN